MKVVFVFVLLVTSGLSSWAQSQMSPELKDLLMKGIGYHDAGEYQHAIDLYDKALDIDSNLVMAMYEKAMSLSEFKKYDECIMLCKKILANYPNEPEVIGVYVVYGNTLDHMNETDEAIELYNEGIKKYPGQYMLLFNKGITLLSIDKQTQAEEAFQAALMIEPSHAGSNLAIGNLMLGQGKRIPAIMALWRMLVIEPSSNRAAIAFRTMNETLTSNIVKGKKGGASINLSADGMKDTTEDGKNKPNNFWLVETTFSLTNMADMALVDAELSKQPLTASQKLLKSCKGLVQSLETNMDRNSGFYWRYYVPYFVELFKKQHDTVFVNLMLAAQKNDDAIAWLTAHEPDIEKFYAWSEAYAWKAE